MVDRGAHLAAIGEDLVLRLHGQAGQMLVGARAPGSALHRAGSGSRGKGLADSGRATGCFGKVDEILDRLAAPEA